MALKYSDIRKRINLSKLNGIENGTAYLTHYWQNASDDIIREYYRGEAIDYLSRLMLEDFQHELPLEYDVPFPPPLNHEFTFIDLFAGIGGFRLAFQRQNGKCVFSS